MLPNASRGCSLRFKDDSDGRKEGKIKSAMSNRIIRRVGEVIYLGRAVVKSIAPRKILPFRAVRVRKRRRGNSGCVEFFFADLVRLPRSPYIPISKRKL